MRLILEAKFGGNPQRCPLAVRAEGKEIKSFLIWFIVNQVQ